MLKRLAAVFSLAMLGIGVAAVPAEAAASHGCADSTFCGFQALNYGQEIWHTSYSNIFNTTSAGITHCLTIGSAKWSNGTYVGNNTGSLVANSSTFPWNNYDLYVFNEDNCNPDGGYDIYYHNNAPNAVPDLRLKSYIGNASISQYHTISSVELIGCTSC